jgi:cell division transport system ATP-binding protein
MIQVYNVCKAYQKDSSALEDISLKIPKGDFVYLTGASGAGKSTLLKLLYGAEKPSRGQILVNGQNITRMVSANIPLLRRRLGIVFQDFKLLNRRTIYENVAFPLEVQGRKRYEVAKKVYQTLKYVGLEHKLQRHPLELSGGEQQRVAIARALVVDPLVLLADEPTGNLDKATGEEILALLGRLNREQNLTIVMVTHDREIAAAADRTVTLVDGRVQAA